MSDQVQIAAHPIYATGDEAIIREYEELKTDRDAWQGRYARVETEAERYQATLEDLARLFAEPGTRTPAELQQEGLRLIGKTCAPSGEGVTLDDPA